MAVAAEAKDTPGSAPLEARWPVAFAIICVFLLLGALPERVRILPAWVLWASAAAVLASLAMVSLATPKSVWQRVETVVVLALAGFGGLASLASLGALLRHVAGRSSSVSGLALLSSSVALWCLNVLIFSLYYWQMDRGGPAGRVGSAHRLPDWSFPQDTAPEFEVRAGWKPTYPDYLFLSFSTATAFSTTEVLPFTTRAKMLMMGEAAISLMTLALVASRAINILGT